MTARRIVLQQIAFASMYNTPKRMSFSSTFWNDTCLFNICRLEKCTVVFRMPKSATQQKLYSSNTVGSKKITNEQFQTNRNHQCATG